MFFNKKKLFTMEYIEQNLAFNTILLFINRKISFDSFFGGVWVRNNRQLFWAWLNKAR